MKRKTWLAAILSLVGAVLLFRAAAAQTSPNPPTDDQVNAVAKQLYCPVCENIPLDVCPTQACQQWRDLIREKLGQGWTSEQIKQYFVNQYGDRVLATPPAHSGLNRLFYIVPVVAILTGVYILYRALKAWRQTAPVRPVQTISPGTGGDGSPQDEYVRRLEEELRSR